jgi:hypothetical protein
MFVKKGILFASVLILCVGMAFATSAPANTSDNEIEARTMITGTVTDATTEAPVPFAEILLNETGISTTSNENGRFNYSGLEPGSYTLTFSAEGYETSEHSVEVTEDGANLNVELYPVD